MTGPPSDCVPTLEALDLYEMAQWASALPVRHGWKGRTCRDLWDAAPHGHWLLHYAGAAGADRRDLVRAAAACARPALRFVPAGEDRPRRAIEAAERWADRPTEGNRRRAKRAGEAAWAAGRAKPVAAGWVKAWLASADAAAAAEMSASADEAETAMASSAYRAAHYHVEGTEPEAAARRACADAVRRLVPFLELPMVATPR